MSKLAHICFTLVACGSVFPIQISRYTVNMAPRYSQKTIFNMVSVRHLEFEKFRFLVKCPSWELKCISDFEEIWCPDAYFGFKNEHMTKMSKISNFSKFKMADVRHIENRLLAISQRFIVRLTRNLVHRSSIML